MSTTQEGPVASWSDFSNVETYVKTQKPQHMSIALLMTAKRINDHYDMT